MIDQKYNKSNLKSIEWSEEFYKFCEFEDFSIEGEHVDSDFINCKFIKDNLNGNCSFKNARAYNCKVENCDGFELINA